MNHVVDFHFALRLFQCLSAISIPHQITNQMVSMSVVSESGLRSMHATFDRVSLDGRVCVREGTRH